MHGLDEVITDSFTLRQNYLFRNGYMFIFSSK